MSVHAIEVVGVSKSFSLGFGVRNRVALNEMSFRVAPGEIYGFLGPNGAGKTTSIKILSALLRPDVGHAFIFGQPPDETEARRRLGYLPESPVFYEHLTGAEFLHFCGALSGMSRGVVRKRAGELLERVGLSHAKDLQIRRYSKGMTQRLGIAQAILHDPALVILDEPMSGLDPMGRTDVRDLILELQGRGKTVFFSTHIIPDVEAICTRVGIVAKGRMVREGTVAQLLQESASGEVDVMVQGLPMAFNPPVGLEKGALKDRRLFVVPAGEQLDRLLHELLKAKGKIVSVMPRQGSLEDLVVKLLANEGGAS